MDGIVVAFARESDRHKFQRLLEAHGFPVSYLCAAGADAVRAVRRQGGGVVVCGFRLRDMTAETLAHRLFGTAEVLVLAPAADLALCEGDNLCKLPSPVSRADFYAALEILHTRAVESHPPGRDAVDHTLVEQAKALLMEVHQMTEPEAHRFLQRYSMNAGIRLPEAAQCLLDTYT